MKRRFLEDYLYSHFFSQSNLSKLIEQLEKESGAETGSPEDINYIRLLIVDPPSSILGKDSDDNFIFTPLLSALFPLCNQSTVIAMTIPDVSEVCFYIYSLIWI
jgi:hypothetical protein